MHKMAWTLNFSSLRTNRRSDTPLCVCIHGLVSPQPAQPGLWLILLSLGLLRQFFPSGLASLTSYKSHAPCGQCAAISSITQVKYCERPRQLLPCWAASLVLVWVTRWVCRTNEVEQKPVASQRLIPAGDESTRLSHSFLSKSNQWIASLLLLLLLRQKNSKNTPVSQWFSSHLLRIPSDAVGV